MTDKINRAAGVLILRPDGKILAVSRKNDLTDWGLPFGKVEEGETDLDAAIRECKEETGLTVVAAYKVFERFGRTMIASTFQAIVTGEIKSSEEGIVRWVTMSDLMAGSFGEYNRNLFLHLGCDLP